MAQQSEPRFVAEAETGLHLLEAKSIAIVGYGNLGHSLALNLRDSGAGPLTVGEVPGPAWEQAVADGFPVSPTPAAAFGGMARFIALDRESWQRSYRETLADIAKALSSGPPRVCPTLGRAADDPAHRQAKSP